MEILDGVPPVTGEVKESCDSCASCCKGGGPILRRGDEHLVKTGKIPLKYLYTIREGELLFDKDKMAMVPLSEDNIKIKINPDTFDCMFLEEGSRCGIYGVRPSECRAFKCWDSRQIEMIYSAGEALTRKDLLKGVEGLWDLIQDHQQRCSYEKLGSLFEEIDSDGSSSATQISDLVNYDRSLRQTLASKGDIDAGIIEFLLGRPLTDTIVMFNYRIVEKDGGLMLEPVS